MKKLVASLIVACAAAFTALNPVRAADEEPAGTVAATELTSEQLDFFEKRIRPLLIDRCYECHSNESEAKEGGLLLDSRAAIMQGGESGPAVVPGKPEGSVLIAAVRYNDVDVQMPPDGRLSPREIDDLVAWVQMGLPDPRDGPVAAVDPPQSRDWLAEASRWWSFQPVVEPPVPSVQAADWPRGEIDHFILARLEAENVPPATTASKRTLIRRVTFDLTGLPPTRDEIADFLGDDSPDAWHNLIERLLGSRHYGERWGRHWLDVVRYADTSGCNGDFPMPEAYRYRNYVIDSFNADKPYDQFLREQLAGDLLDYETQRQHREQLVATGYLAISRRFSSLGEEFHLTLDDTIDNVGKGLLGLSLSCARCHAHKFDPVPQEDYYALYGIFESSRYTFPGTEIYRHTKDWIPLEAADRVAELEPYLTRMRALDDEIFRIYTHMASLDTGKEKDAERARWKKLEKERDELVKQLPAFEKAYGVTDGQATKTRLHIKGDPEDLGEEIPRGFLRVLGGQRVPADESGSGRRQLAEWLTDPTNPLTARVIVNRVWLHHFGQGLVRTPDEFGTRGEEPTHPQLLDWLTTQFIRSGWSIKQLHRWILTSASYQMACIEDESLQQPDPDNRLYWRFNRRRLEAEELRDAVLAISGQLDRTVGGPHPFPPEVKWRYSQHRPFVDDFPTNRRSVYLMQQRIRLQPYLSIFDGADTNAATGKRHVSTTPLQALFLMNNEFVHEQADYYAKRLHQEAKSPQQRIRLAFELAYGRVPLPDEVDIAQSYLRQIEEELVGTAQGAEEAEQLAMASYLRVLFSSNEFAFVE